MGVIGGMAETEADEGVVGVGFGVFVSASDTVRVRGHEDVAEALTDGLLVIWPVTEAECDWDCCSEGVNVAGGITEADCESVGASEIEDEAVGASEGGGCKRSRRRSSSIN